MLELKHITKDYSLGKNDSVKALKDINLRFKNTGFVAILGPSGCGKTTLLNIISGLDHYTSGDLIIDGISTKQFNDRDWDDYRNKKVGMVFQNYNLVSHLSISENTSLPLTLAGVDPKERKEKIGLAMEATGLVGQENKNPNQLSGGQQQRVAIARSIINSPSILLADEPTGALDSVTSVLVMNMLNELSKDVLILMVTHNNELAYKYADRIISIKDGQIIGDFVNTRKEASIEPTDSTQVPVGSLTKDETDSLKALSTREIAIKIKKKKARMGFWTAFKMSVKNLATKKGRTIITSIAASFGIIGVGLVLAVSNGFSGYVSRMEAESLSKLPITIDTYAAPPDSLLGGIGGEKNDLPEYPADDVIKVKPPKNASFHVNNITEDYYNAFLLGGTDSEGRQWPGINTYVNAKDDKKKVSIDNHYSVSANVVTQDANIKDAYKALNTAPLSAMDKIKTQSYWSELPDRDDVLEQYDLIDGKMPSYDDPHGLLITVDKYNAVATETLKALGFDTNSGLAENDKTITLTDLTEHTFKLIKNEDFYTKQDKTKDVNGLSLLADKTYSDYLAVVSKMAALDQGATFEEYQVIAQDFLSLFLEIDFTQYPNQTREVVQILMDSQGNPNDGQKKRIAALILQMVVDNPPETTDSLDTYHKPKDNTPEMKEIYEQAESEELHIVGVLRLKKDTSVGVLSSGAYYTPALTQRVLDMAKASEIANCSNKYMMLDFTPPKDEDKDKDKDKEIQPLAGIDGLLSFYSMIDDNATIDGETYSSQRKMVGSDIAISSISITPKNFSDKDKVLEYLDSYNRGRQDKDQIQYTDIAGSLMASISTMVRVISTVLIVFASISLAVSSVMIGIIIYVSVIERTKEIGTLRSVGARKKDVGRLFIMESIAIGLFSGILGVLASYILSIPINYAVNMIYAGFGIGTIAFLNPWHAVLLVVISITLTMIAGLIPSLIASRKDPVKCLRTE